MKVLILIAFATILSQPDAFAAPQQSQCSDSCKVALIDNEFESSFHSGVSSVKIAESVYSACGKNEKIEQECSKNIVPNEGSMVYSFYAGCVLESVKKDCQDRYDANR